jgi:F0F1-type ATP synthase delta subunit
MKTLTKDARGFVDGVMQYIKSDGKSQTANTKVRAMLSRVSEIDKSENRATVETAIPLDSKEKSLFERAVQKIIGHPLEMVYMVNPDLIGGYRLTIGDYIMDDSLASQLNQLQSVLL